jgi:hypothetical protein
MDLFDVKREGTIDLPAIEFETSKKLNDWEDLEESDLQETYADAEQETFPIYSGYEVKSFELAGTEASPSMVFKIFKNMVNLESLTLSLMEAHNGAKTLPKRGGGIVSWYAKQYDGFRVLRGAKNKNFKQVVENAGLEYDKGNGFYQVTKKEKVTAKKSIIVIDTTDDNKLYQNNAAKEKLGVSLRSAKYDLVPRDGLVIMVQSTSATRKLDDGMFIMYATHDDSETLEDDESKFIPQLLHLKSFTLESEGLSDVTVAQYLQLMPNLEVFDYVFTIPPGESFMTLLGDKNPNLKKLKIKSDSGATPYESGINDDHILYLMQNTKLEELNLKQAANVSGKLFHTMGVHCQHLQKLKISRVCHNGELCPQEEVYFGPVVMPNMRTIAISGAWANLSERYVDTMITAMPNLKAVHLDKMREGRQDSDYKHPDYTKLIDACDLEEFYFSFQVGWKQQTVDSEVRKKYSAALQKKKNLRVLRMTGDDQVLFTIEELKNLHFPKMRSWEGPISPSQEYLEAFHNAFPNLTTIKTFIEEKSDGKVVDFFNDPTHWPDLRFVDVSVNRTKINLPNRPYVMIEGSQGRKYGDKSPITRENYIRDWLHSDKKPETSY